MNADEKIKFTNISILAQDVKGRFIPTDITLHEDGTLIFNVHFYIYDPSFRSLVRSLLDPSDIDQIESKMNDYLAWEGSYLCG